MTTPIIPPKEKERSAPIKLAISLQNIYVHPWSLCAFNPENAASMSADEISQNIAATNPPPYAATPSAPPKSANGEVAVKRPKPEIAPITPRIPKISAIQGVTLTKTSFALLGRDGAFANWGSSTATMSFDLC